MSTTEKQIRRFYDLCAARENYRVVPWEFEKAEINLLCRYSVRMMSGYDVPLDAEQQRQAEILNHGLLCGYVRITPAHENEGLTWLWSHHKAGWLGPKELRIMRRFSHFTLRGVATVRDSAHVPFHSVPIYCVHGDGGSFAYEAWSWQSGRKPKLVTDAFWCEQEGVAA
jgi:hypothetical protein